MRAQQTSLGLMTTQLSLALIIFCATSCATPGKNGDSGRSNTPVVAKAGTKQNPPPSAVPPPPAISKGPTLDEQLHFVHSHSDPATTFSEQDHQFVSSLPSSPPAGSMTEAALAVGLVGTVLHPANFTPPRFHEAELGKGRGGTANTDAPIASKVLSLEYLCKERRINLPDALSENALLATAGIAKQVLSALSEGQNSKEFTDEVMASLRKNARPWQELIVSLGLAAAGFEAAQTVPGPANSSGDGAEAVPLAKSPAGELPPAVIPGPPSPASDNTLSEAQKLADQGEYQSAIAKAKAIPNGSPERPLAEDKIKAYSDLAVQDLRKKAASAFQTAMPMSDAKARAEYLKQAKGFLEEAIRSYPDATQLPTVRENLRIISNDLEGMQ